MSLETVCIECGETVIEQDAAAVGRGQWILLSYSTVVEENTIVNEVRDMHGSLSVFMLNCCS